MTAGHSRVVLGGIVASFPPYDVGLVIQQGYIKVRTRLDRHFSAESNAGQTEIGEKKEERREIGEMSCDAHINTARSDTRRID